MSGPRTGTKRRPSHPARSGAAVAVLLLATLAPAARASGVLTLVDQDRNGVGGIADLVDPEATVVSPDGRHVYVASPTRDDIVIFRRDATSGELAYAGTVNPLTPANPLGLDGLAVSPDGRFVYASFRDGRVRWYARNATSGLLSLAGQHVEGDPTKEFLDGAGAMAISADGSSLWVAASDEKRISLFRRDLATGALTYSQAANAFEDGSDWLAGLVEIALSPDGRNLYATAGISDALVVFSIRGDGRLLMRQRLVNGVAGLDLLDGPSGVAVSPDGRFVYATSYVDGALVTFKRGPTGLLEQRHRLDLPGNSFGVVLDGVGDRVYVATDDGVTALRRNVESGVPSTGLGGFHDGAEGVQNLAGARRPVLSPDDAFVYVAARSDDAITTIATADDGLRLGKNRFRVTARFTLQGQPQQEAQPLALSADTGYYYYFERSNVELLVKVLDGCAINGRWWVFVGGLTNVRVDLEVVDTKTGAVRTYVNPQNTPFVPKQDTQAFASCP